MSDTDELDGSAAPLIEHLRELRTRILISISALAVCFLLGYLVWEQVFHILSIPMCDALAERGEQCQFILVKLQEGFFVAIKIAIWAGFALAFPVIGFQMWRFVAPGLYRNEKAAFLPFLIASPVMFMIGAAFAYFVILPFAFAFFLGYQDQFASAMQSSGPLTAAPAGAVYTGSVEAFLSLTMTFVMSFGLCFQLPVLLTLMGKAGLISSKGLKATRKYAVVAILAVAAVVTPPDVFSQAILFGAIYPLYEISIWLIARFEREREAQARADGTWVDEDEDE